MYIQVRLFQRLPEPLLYEVPVHHQSQIKQGTIVNVPLRNKIVSAYVENILVSKPQTRFNIKSIAGIAAIPNDPFYYSFIQKLSYYYQTEPLFFIKRIQQFLGEEQHVDSSMSAEVEHVPKVVTLTPEQKEITIQLEQAIEKKSYFPALLHGLTGSGKTEIYKELILKTVIGQKKTVLLLLPEVTLSVQFHRILSKELPSAIPIFGFHSAASIKEKRSLWHHLLEQQPSLIIGVHLPIMLPIGNLGLIIIDEEHELGYQEKKHPKINTKEAALLRASINQIPILLGSATPSISSLDNVNKRGWHFFQLTKRFNGSLPSVRTVPLLDDPKKRSFFWISTVLEAAIRDRLERNEQSIIFLNRRGYSFFVQCKKCSFIFYCPHCSVSLTLHDNQKLSCHYCGFEQCQPSHCAGCKAPEKELLRKGIGTQQVVTILQKMFPQARIARADLDTTINKKKWHRITHDFYQGDIDILVGTQTITKGYHFPKVTLVGVLWADLNLNFPIYNAAESTLQQLIQVAGRAGRCLQTGQVIIQHLVSHPIFSYLNEIDYISFCKYEAEKRKLIGYPPFIKLAEIELKNRCEHTVYNESEKLKQELESAIRSANIHILGPAKPPIHKIKNMHSRKLYIKGNTIQEIIHVLSVVDIKSYKSAVYFTPNPLS